MLPSSGCKPERTIDGRRQAHESDAVVRIDAGALPCRMPGRGRCLYVKTDDDRVRLDRVARSLRRRLVVGGRRPHDSEAMTYAGVDVRITEVVGSNNTSLISQMVTVTGDASSVETGPANNADATLNLAVMPQGATTITETTTEYSCLIQNSDGGDGADESGTSNTRLVKLFPTLPGHQTTQMESFLCPGLLYQRLETGVGAETSAALKLRKNLGDDRFLFHPLAGLAWDVAIKRDNGNFEILELKVGLAPRYGPGYLMLSGNVRELRLHFEDRQRLRRQYPFTIERIDQQLRTEASECKPDHELASTDVRKAAVAALAAGANIAPQTPDKVKWFGIEESSEEGEGENP